MFHDTLVPFEERRIIKMKISIVVPVYNVEKYLDRCIKSLLNQSIEEYEILLIDDGSKDNSGKMCDEYQRRDSRIKVFHKENEGLGLTRNYGMNQAAGEYILFVDSDDYIAQECLKDLYSYVTADSCDVCFFERAFYKGGIVDFNHDVYPEKIEYKKLATMCLGEPLKQDAFEIGPAWKALYKRSFLLDNGLFFESERDILSEDYVFSARLCLANPKICFFNKTVYFYCDNGDSLTNSYNPQRPFKAVNLYNRMIEICLANNLGDEAEYRAYNNFLINMLVSFKHLTLNTAMKKAEKLRLISDLCHNQKIMAIIRSISCTDGSRLRLLKYLMLHKHVKIIYWLMVARYGRK